MPDPRFFTRAGPFPLATLATIGGARLGPGAEPALLVEDVAPLGSAGPRDISFFDNPRYLDALKTSRAGACILAESAAAAAPPGTALLLAPDPYLAYALIAAHFYPPAAAATAGVHASAVVDPTARLGADCSVGAFTVIGARAEIGAGARIGPQVSIGEGVVIGAGTVIGPGASIRFSLIGARCQIHAGARLGERGFGFARGPQGPVDVPQLGRVIVEDEVEIGANTTVDRGAGPDTVIGAGTRIDNLVQIAHNVTIGRHCIIIGQAGVAGSSHLEDGAVLAAQAGVAGHVRIGRGAQVAAQSGVMRDVGPGERVCGAPAVPVRQFFRQHAALTRLATGKSNRDDAS